MQSAQCNPHDAIRTVQSARRNPTMRSHDGIRTMESARWNPTMRSHDGIRTMEWRFCSGFDFAATYQSARGNPHDGIRMMESAWWNPHDGVGWNAQDRICIMEQDRMRRTMESARWGRMECAGWNLHNWSRMECARWNPHSASCTMRSHDAAWYDPTMRSHNAILTMRSVQCDLTWWYNPHNAILQSLWCNPHNTTKASHPKHTRVATFEAKIEDKAVKMKRSKDRTWPTQRRSRTPERATAKNNKKAEATKQFAFQKNQIPQFCTPSLKLTNVIGKRNKKR